MSPGPQEMSKSYQEMSKIPQEIKNHKESSAVDRREPITHESPGKAPNKQKQMVANELEVESLGDGSEEEDEESNIYDDPIDLKLRESAKQICDDVYSKVSKKPSEEKNGCNVDEKRKSEVSLSQDDFMEESLSNAIYASINKAAKKNKEVNLESVTSTMI